MDQGNLDAAEKAFLLQRAAIKKLVLQHPDAGFIYLELANNGYHLALIKQSRGDCSAALQQTDQLLSEVSAYQSQFPNLQRNFQKHEVDLLVLRSNLHQLNDDVARAKADLQQAVSVCEDVCNVPQPSATWLRELRTRRAELKRLNNQTEAY